MENVTIDLNELSRVFKIKNTLGQTMFIVSFIVLEDGNQNGKYLVKVREITNLYIPKDIIREFFSADELKKAIETTNKLVEDYTTLVKSIKEPIDPRLVFNDSVNYKVIDPDCCSNCTYSILSDKDLSVDYKTGRKIPQCLFCTCKKNLRQHEYTWDLFGENAISSTDFDSMMIQVSFDGICNNYYRNTEDFLNE